MSRLNSPLIKRSYKPTFSQCFRMALCGCSCRFTYSCCHCYHYALWLTWWRNNVDVTEITVHVTMLQRETPRVYPSRDVAIQFARFESGGLQHLEYPSREGLSFHDVKELKERLLKEWRLLDHTIIAAAAIAQWCSRLNAYMCSREWWTFWT